MKKNYSYQSGGKPLKIQKLSSKTIKKKIKKLKKRNYLGSEIIDWNNIDFSAGKGILNDKDRCYWTTNGNRISIVKSAICGTKNIYQGWNTDPFYPNLNKNKFKRKAKNV
mgnify:FL=1